MPDSAEAAVTALAGSTTEIVGRFQYDVTSQKWWWSPSLYTIHGFTPGEIVPTTALMIAHQHPDDQACGVDMITAAIATGTPFSSRHRIVDARLHHRRHQLSAPGPRQGHPAGRRTIRRVPRRDRTGQGGLDDHLRTRRR